MSGLLEGLPVVKPKKRGSKSPGAPRSIKDEQVIQWVTKICSSETPLDEYPEPKKTRSSSETKPNKKNQKKDETVLGGFSGNISLLKKSSHITRSPGDIEGYCGIADQFEADEDPLQKDSTKNFTGTVADVNLRFQNVSRKIKSLSTFTSFPDMINISLEFVQVSQDFLMASRNFGKTIISEAFIPVEHKTIKPINIGGVIGGEKYIVHSILFKFAVSDMLDDVAAAKVAGHDLKSATIWTSASAKIPELHIPMQCIIDYLGFRLLAMTLLPIGKSLKSLKVGTEDAGKTFHNDDPKLLELMNIVGETMNLALHEFHGHSVRAAVDIEGHLGTDGRYYVIDLSRTCPPMIPNNFTSVKDAVPHFHLFQLMRPEFLQKYKEPICSDCVSNFLPSNAPSTRKFNQTLKEACEYMYKTVIPGFAPDFEQRVLLEIRRKRVFPGNYKFSIGRALHEAGINLRCLGLIYDNCTQNVAKSLILIEMAARTIKRLLRARMRSKMKALRFPLAIPYIQETVGFLNDCIFRTNDFLVWKKHLQPAFHTCFSWIPPDGKNLREMVWSCPIPSATHPDKVGYRLLLERIYTMLQLKVRPTWQPQAAMICEPNLPAESETPLYTTLSILSVMELGERIKTLPIIPHAYGYVIKNLEKANKCLSFKIEDRAKLALEKFEEALDGMPTNPITLRNCATSCGELIFAKAAMRTRDRFVLDVAEANKLMTDYKDEIEYIHLLFQKSILHGPKDTHTHFQYGSFLLLLREFDDAQTQLLHSLEANNVHSETILALKDLWLNHSKSELSKTLLDILQGLEEKERNRITDNTTRRNATKTVFN